MIWGERPSDDATATQQLPKVPGTVPNRVVTDEFLAGMSPTQTFALDEYDALAEPVKRRTSHRKPPRAVLTWRETAVVAVALGAGVFGVVLMFSGSGSPAPATSHQAAPEAVTTLSPSPTRAKVKRPPVRPAEPATVRSMRPAPAAVRVTVTVTAKATPTHSTPSPAKSVKPSPTSSATPVIPETADPEPTTPPASDADETSDEETPDGDA